MSVSRIEAMNMSAPEALLKSHKVIITDAWMISYPNDTERMQEDLESASWFQGYLPPNTSIVEPVSGIFYPILEKAYQNIKPLNSLQDENLVGFFSLTIYWRDTIRNILPEGSNGVLIVFDSPCNPTFT
jgi:hypothetical protein